MTLGNSCARLKAPSVLLATLALALSAAALGQSESDPVYLWRLQPDGYELVFGLNDSQHVYYRVPILLAFDEEGRSLKVLQSHSKRTGNDILDSLASRSLLGGDSPSRAALVSHIGQLAGDPLPEPGDLIELFVFSATWCLPCHRLVRELDEAVQEGLPVRIVVVEADLVKESTEVQVELLGTHLNPPSEWQQ